MKSAAQSGIGLLSKHIIPIRNRQRQLRYLRLNRIQAFSTLRNCRGAHWCDPVNIWSQLTKLGVNVAKAANILKKLRRDRMLDKYKGDFYLSVSSRTHRLLRLRVR